MDTSQKIEKRSKTKQTRNKKSKLDRLPTRTQMWIIKEYEKTLSYRNLSKKIKKKYGVKIGSSALRDWIVRRKKEIGDIVVGSPEYKDRLSDEYSEILFEFRKLNDKTWELICELESAGEVRYRLDAFREIREQIELANQILGFVEPRREEKNAETSLKNIGVKIAKNIDRQIESGKVSVEEEKSKRKYSVGNDKNENYIEIKSKQ